jgi:MFS family permease
MIAPDNTPAPTRSGDFRIPTVIKRNMALFALSQSFTGTGMQFAFGLGPLMAVALTGSSALAGLFVGLLGASRFLVSYPIGKITDAYGRKPGIQFGLVLAFAGALITGASMPLASAAVLTAGLLIFSAGMAATQQLRVAAADMFPAHRRATALGYLALGATAGLVFAAPAMGLAEAIAEWLHQDKLAMAWFLVPVPTVAGMILIAFVRPDPKEIGMNLHRYYPGVAPSAAPIARGRFQARRVLAHPRLRLAVVSNCAAQANMSIVMVLTSLVLHHHGHSPSAIVLAHAFHSAGMFAFTIPLGALVDRFGTERVMFPGVAIAFVGAVLVAFTGSYWSVTLGTFLVGVGWAAANVAATTLVANHFPTEERGRAIGVTESLAGGTSVVMALVTGPLIEGSGLPATGLVAALVTLPPLLMWAASLIGKRRAPGEILERPGIAGD